MSDPPKFSFGGTPTSGAGGSGLFGQSTTPATGPSGLFGSNPTGVSTSGSTPAFGATSNTSQPPSLFSPKPATSNQGSNIFGGGSGTGTSNLFGGAGNTPSTGFSFGQKPATGGGDNKSASPFPAFSTPNKPSTPSTSEQTQTSSLFGAAAKPSAPLFAGSNNPSSAAGSTTPAPNKPLFGSLSTTPAGPPPAGASTENTGSGAGLNAQNPAPQLGGLFGASNAPQASSEQKPGASAPSGGLFGGSSLFSGAQKPQTSDTTAKPTETQPPSLFGSSTANTTSNLFQSPAAQPSGNLFGNLGKPATDTASTTGAGAKPTGTTASATDSASKGNETEQAPKPQGLFGGASTQPAKSPFSFPSSNAASTQSSSTPTATTTAGSGSTLFGGKPPAPTTAPSSTSADAKSGGLFGNLNKTPGQSSTTAAATPSTTATSGPSQTQPTSGESAPSSSLFGNKPASTTTPQPTTTGAPGGGLFGGANKQAPATSTQPSATATSTAASAPAGGLGASTAGPAPPAQSRLKNKSMDDIITRWASDLSKYQKQFQQQAQKVADWDRMLVENSDKISNLYASTFEAQRASSEVERQLTAVESQQDELSGWLDRYEREVDDMMSRQIGQGEGLQGPDQERERTYKLAEKLSERLDEMGKDLTSMIDEVNNASSTLSKTSKAGDPLSQIVKVLNGHLSQLQLIDQGAAKLQAKVAAAQKAGQGLGMNGYNGSRHDAADDFYRSYMGRR
ncbi:hypothetical protein L228DRAFT_247724 [Xylona heveae TC161]|uniref:Nucleoporin NSP1 n=1 Tax=Xylona heveae (strain CBS 132557 / TC161) TaxID=1328760 RepID=A0A165GEW1_XYLHT|nr:hypothetical protein L228DRAFT_247724 [Xylona heveae TC161]KZF22103.1 hypothetical protein L228DRAFT_247724 [Xylona heveae TC161]